MQIGLRGIAWLGVFTLVVMAWLWLFFMAQSMDLDVFGRPGTMGEVMRQMDPRMDMRMPMAEFGPLFGMWAVMMAAMMLPTMWPTMRAYEDLMHSANGSFAGWAGLLGGYLTIWVGFAAVIAGVQLWLLFAGVVDMLGIATSAYVQGGLLILVGAFQFTALKETCHGVCHAPMSYFLGYWRTGFSGGARMGLGLGVYCVGCCWGFMALGFVGGVMSLLWMGLATAFMILEKLPEIGHRVMRPMGAALIVAGLYMLVRPSVMGG